MVSSCENAQGGQPCFMLRLWRTKKASAPGYGSAFPTLRKAGGCQGGKAYRRVHIHPDRGQYTFRPYRVHQVSGSDRTLRRLPHNRGELHGIYHPQGGLRQDQQEYFRLCQPELPGQSSARGRGQPRDGGGGRRRAADLEAAAQGVSGGCGKLSGRETWRG